MKDSQPSQRKVATLATQLIGTPYKPGGNDIYALDCWGLVQYFYGQLGMHIPKNYDLSIRTTARDILKLTEKEAGGDEWEKIDCPDELCLVAMGKNDKITHVGVWIAGGVLHANELAGVVYESPINIRRNYSKDLTFYRWHKFT